jgi:hypothetical protein
MTLLGNKHFGRCNQVKMRLYGISVGPNSMTDTLIKTHTHTHTHTHTNEK